MNITSIFAAALSVSLVTGVAHAQAPAPGPKPANLDQLLQLVKQGWRAESEQQKAREAEFVAARDQQKKLLEQAQAQLAAVEQRSETLEKTFDANEGRTAQLEVTLQTRLGTMGELFGVIRQVAGEAHGRILGSVISAQIPGRDAAIAKLASSKELPSLEQLEQLWFTLQQEMIESGKVVRFTSPVVAVAGGEAPAAVIRVGSFNVISDGKYLHWLPEVKKLAELGRQPASRYLSTVDDLESAKSGLVQFAIDPSRGSILALLVDTKSFMERLDDGGPVGWAIVFLGLITFVFAIIRGLYLTYVSMRVRRQESQKQARDDNPLGRVLLVYEQNRGIDLETLERKLDEAILHETALLDRFLWAFKVVSVVAPLMGLLGTITGMIRTFQAITLYGTGDPKLMASGISEALVTTMEGLIVAIPLVLIHSWLTSITRRIGDVLTEESAGIVAEHAEKERE